MSAMKDALIQVADALGIEDVNSEQAYEAAQRWLDAERPPMEAWAAEERQRLASNPPQVLPNDRLVSGELVVASVVYNDDEWPMIWTVLLLDPSAWGRVKTMRPLRCWRCSLPLITTGPLHGGSGAERTWSVAQ